MEPVTELAARAATYLVLVQEAARQSPEKTWATLPGLASLPNRTEWERHASTWFALDPALRQRAHELSPTVPLPALPDEERAICRLDPTAATNYLTAADWFRQFSSTTSELLTLMEEWLTSAPLDPIFHPRRRVTPPEPGAAPEKPKLPKRTRNSDHFVAADVWRRWLHLRLYETPAHRRTLAQTLHLIPGLVWTALSAPARRTPEPHEPPRRAPAWVAAAPLDPPTAHAELQKPDSPVVPLLLDDEALRAELALIGHPIPFALAFSVELTDVRDRRAKFADLRPKKAPALPPDALPPSPTEQAKALELVGLAFSGGGIRSATFNLGVLQRLAQVGWLPEIDYLSTVSGGGYLGSWFVAWVMRLGSLRDVAARLDKYVAPNPLAEEVRPLRWLRQYSNYLTPNASPLSVDSWTMGVTWLRNTLLNQLVIGLAFGGALGTVFALMGLWLSPGYVSRKVSEGGHLVGAWTAVAVVFAVAACLAAWGMRRYHAPRKTPTGKWERRVPLMLIGLAGVMAFAAAAVLWQNAPPAGFLARCRWLWPAGAFTAVALLAVAIGGRYDNCFSPRYAAPTRWLLLVLSTLAAAAAGLALLVIAWEGLDTLTYDPVLGGGNRSDHPGSRWAFVLGPPLLLEVAVLTIVARMALLGSHFPDERREWWGRLGGGAHLLVVGWVVVAGIVALSLELLDLGTELLTAAGGSTALILAGIRLAASARTSAQPQDQAPPLWQTTLLAVVPYLFIVGLLVAESLLIEKVLNPLGVTDSGSLYVWGGLVVSATGVIGGGLLAWCLGVNEFSLHHFYRNRLVRAYLGASRRREERDLTANPFTKFDVRLDDLRLARLRRSAGPGAAAAPEATPPASPYDGPYPLLNVALNATRASDLARQDRMAESFVFSPRYCGFDISRVRGKRAADAAAEYGYQPTERYAAPDGGPTLGTAMAISGAAANPNSGYHSSPAMGFLLTLFNVRLGWWMGNPSSRRWQRMSPQMGLGYLVKDLFASSRTDDEYVCLSDGGHFDNMGLYELIRRRCRYIILGDSEEDADFRCEGLATAIRNCRIDFGVEIDLDLRPIIHRVDKRHSGAHFVIGNIYYPDGFTGKLLYLKASLTGNEPADVREYAHQNAAFPHQPTLPDQFFSEAQFESYRRLGFHVASDAVRVFGQGRTLTLAQRFAKQPIVRRAYPDGPLPRPAAGSQPPTSPATKMGDTDE